MPPESLGLETSKTGASREERERHEIIDGVLALKDYSKWPKNNLDRLAKLGEWAAVRGAVVKSQEDNRRVTPDGMEDLADRDCVKMLEPDNILIRDHSRQSGSKPTSEDQVYSWRNIADHTNTDFNRQNRSTMLMSQQKHPLNAASHTVQWVRLVPRLAPSGAQGLELWDATGEPTWCRGVDPFQRDGIFFNTQVKRDTQTLDAGELIDPIEGTSETIKIGQTQISRGAKTAQSADLIKRFVAAITTGASENSGYVCGWAKPNGQKVRHLSQLFQLFSPVFLADESGIEGSVDPEDATTWGWLGLRPDTYLTSPDRNVYGPLSFRPEQWDYSSNLETIPSYSWLSLGDLYFSQLGNTLDGQVYDKNDNSEARKLHDFKRPDTPWNVRVVSGTSDFDLYPSPPSIFSGNPHKSQDADVRPFGFPGSILSPALAQNVDWSKRLRGPNTYSFTNHDGEDLHNGFRFGLHWNDRIQNIDRVSIDYFRDGKRFLDDRPVMIGEPGTIPPRSALAVANRFTVIIADLNDVAPLLEWNEEQATIFTERGADFLQSLAQHSNGIGSAEGVEAKLTIFREAIAPNLKFPTDSHFSYVPFLPNAVSRPPFQKIPVNPSGFRRGNEWRLAKTILNDIAAYLNRKRLKRIQKLGDGFTGETTDLGDSDIDVSQLGKAVVSAVQNIEFDGLSEVTASGTTALFSNIAGVGKIDGAAITFVDIENVSVGTTLERTVLADSTNEHLMSFVGTLNADIMASGLGGLDTGSLNPDEPWAVMVIGDKNKVLPTALLLTQTPLAPILPAGYNIFREVSWILLDGSTEITEFDAVGKGRLLIFFWISAGSTRFVLSGGNATGPTATAIDCSRLIPPIGKAFGLFGLAQNGTPAVSLRQSATGVDIATLTRAQNIAGMFVTDSLQRIFYTNSSPAGNVDVIVRGFFYRR